jgi:hypothetical protein
MPPLDTDISSAAIALVREHGDRAPIHAAMEADRLLEATDLGGAAHWRLVLAAVGRAGKGQTLGFRSPIAARERLRELYRLGRSTGIWTKAHRFTTWTIVKMLNRRCDAANTRPETLDALAMKMDQSMGPAQLCEQIDVWKI